MFAGVSESTEIANNQGSTAITIEKSRSNDVLTFHRHTLHCAQHFFFMYEA